MARCEACYWCKQRVEGCGKRVAACAKGHRLRANGGPGSVVVSLPGEFKYATCLLLRKRKCEDFCSMNDRGGDWSPGLIEARNYNRQRGREGYSAKKHLASKGKEAVGAGQVSESV